LLGGDTGASRTTLARITGSQSRPLQATVKIGIRTYLKSAVSIIVVSNLPPALLIAVIQALIGARQNLAGKNFPEKYKRYGQQNKFAPFSDCKNRIYHF
jgi:hypothetical protein